MTYNIFPKGALTHHSPLASGGIPPVGRAVRSRGAALQIFDLNRRGLPEADLLAFQASNLRGDAASADAFQPISLREIGWTAGLCLRAERMASTMQARKRASPAAAGNRPPAGFLLGGTEERRTTKETEMIYDSNLSSGGEGHQPRRGAFCCRGCGLHELLANLQRLRRRAARLQ